MPFSRQKLRQLWLSPVYFYRRVLSPLKGRATCRYLPTCSEYAIEAVQSRGIFVGTAKAVWRILRCNPLFRGGYDPVNTEGPVSEEPLKPDAAAPCLACERTGN